jgi:argininosuccinate lyase
MSSAGKPWGGRFTAATDKTVEQFTESVAFDHRLFRQDIKGSIAHAQMLKRIGVLDEHELQAIVDGLNAIETEIENGKFEWSAALEDVHMNIETALTQRIGEAGKKLHTGRSRNDQVATDLRLYLREAVGDTLGLLTELQRTLVDLAEREADTIMPGFTHLQVAQPVTFGHHILAWVEMLARDEQRLRDSLARTNVMPLGAAALAGTSFSLDRDYTAELLGFDRPAENSIDAVSDRDFAIEYCANCAIAMMHLSRMAEEVILWTTEQFGFIELDDAFCTGSSIMPQKKNPDVAELVRGKTARVVGHLTALLALMKSQPLAYNRDNQEDKEPLFDCVDTITRSLNVFIGLIGSMRINRERMYQAASRGFATATDLAEYLVRKGVAFRDAHAVVGGAVKTCIEKGVDLPGLGLPALQAMCDRIEEDVMPILTLEGSVNARDHTGGTAPAQVRAAVQRARERLASN